MKKLTRIILCCAALCVSSASTMADIISFVNPLTNVDNTAGWSTTDSLAYLGQSYSLLGGNATVGAYVDVSDGLLTHRLTRGLGIYGGEMDEIDRNNSAAGALSSVEHIDITFDTMDYYVNEIEVRSLFNTDTTGINAEWAAIAFYYDDVLLQTDYLQGSEILNTGDGDAEWTGFILVDQLVFYVPTISELTAAGYGQYISTFDPALSEFALAKLDVTLVPVPGALLLGFLGMAVAGAKLRRLA